MLAQISKVIQARNNTETSGKNFYGNLTSKINKDIELDYKNAHLILAKEPKTLQDFINSKVDKHKETCNIDN